MVDVFISYCRDDEAYLNRLLLTLKGYDLTVSETCWDNDNQFDTRQVATTSARLAVLMVTPSYLASDFIVQHELPALLNRAAAGALTMMPLPVRPVDWQVQAFSVYQSLLDPEAPLGSLAGHDQDAAYVKIGQGVVGQLARFRTVLNAQTGSVPALDPLAEELASLHQQRSRLAVEGQALDDISAQIKARRRRLREGRQPQRGDVLCARYELEHQLGAGGFATVWRAMDRQLNQLVALKLLHGQYSEDRSRRERFFRGARKMAGLRHPGIVTVLEQACQDGPLHFYVMEYLPGGDLEAAVHRGDLAREQWLPILLQVGAALQYAHDQGLIHRDIKPSNILLDLQNRPHLCDFDLVRDDQSTAGTRDGLGTFIYAAPECLHNGAEGDVRADVFGLAMTLVFALAGKKLPLAALVNAPAFIDTLGLPMSLAQALAQAVALDRNARTASVAIFCAEVQASLQEPFNLPADAPGFKLGPRWVLLGLSCSVLSMSFLGWSLHGMTLEKLNVVWIMLAKSSSEEQQYPTPVEMNPDASVSRSWAIRSGQDPDEAEYEVKVVQSKPSPEKQWRPAPVEMNPDASVSRAWAIRSGRDPYGTWAELEVKGVCTRLRWIPPSNFMMGSPYRERERFEDELQHHVTLTQGFWLGETEVTQALWVAVMGSNPSAFKGEDLPVDTVSWDDVVVFLDKLNQRLPGLAMRLPTEAEWEFACRAGTETPFSFGQQIHSSQVNFDGKYPYYWGVISEYRARTVAVKSLLGNAWGLHEMHGNVWEWCSDYYGDYFYQAVIDPQGPSTGDLRELRVLRGGSWDDFGTSVRSAFRFSLPPSTRYQSSGFRLARSP